jgi:hypothetical protein
MNHSQANQKAQAGLVEKNANQRARQKAQCDNGSGSARSGWFFIGHKTPLPRLNVQGQ